MTTDTRPRVQLDGKVIDLALLAEEVGADLTASDAEVVVAHETADVTVEQLAAAVARHVPPERPARPTIEDRLAALESKIGKDDDIEALNARIRAVVQQEPPMAALRKLAAVLTGDDPESPGVPGKPRG